MTKKKLFGALTIIVILLSGATGLFYSKGANSQRQKNYNSGDAVSYNGKLYFASTNMNGFELFALEGERIERKAKFSSFDAIYSGFADFNDVMLKSTGGRLYAYLIDGRKIYKYDVSAPSSIQLVKEFKANFGDWPMGIKKLDDMYYYTVSDRKVIVWNSDDIVTDSFDIRSSNGYNTSLSSSGKFVFNLDKGNFKIYSALDRRNVSEFTFNMKASHNMGICNDPEDSAIIFADDKELRKVNYDGRTLAVKKHISNEAYDVIPAADKNFVYFSDGFGVVKARKSDLEMVDWVYTTRLDDDGGWAMGLKSASDRTGEKIVVFAGENIIVLNDKLDHVDSYRAIGETSAAVEGLSLKVDKNRAAPNSQLILTGKGFGLNEELSIMFAGTFTRAWADDNGTFTRIITVPNALPGGTDIKVDGIASKRTYSIGFQVE